MTNQRVTIIDVAHGAGVALSTASQALNGRGRISEETRRRVAEVAAELGYRPRANAQGLRRGRTMAIGLRFGGGLVPQADFIIDLLNGAATAAHEHGYGLLISASSLSEPEMVDGLIVVDPITERDVEVDGLRVITIGRALGQRVVPYVDLDYKASIRLLMEHVGPSAPDGPGWLLNEDAGASFNVDLPESFRAWGHAAGRETRVLACTEETALDVLRAELDRNPAPAILVSASGRVGSEVQRHLLGRGLRIPQDIVLASALDDLALRAADPAIPAIDGDGHGHGRQAVQAMVDWLDHDVTPGNIVLTPRLLVR